MIFQTVFANAKINLGLRISARYADGYHRLESLFYPVNIFDTISIRSAPQGNDSITFEIPPTKALNFKRDLLCSRFMYRVLELARVLAAARGQKIPALAVHVQKRIPSPSGLGGASSDAAAIMGAILSPPYTSNEISRIEALGADIPYFLQHGHKGEAAWLSGRGKELKTLDAPQLHGWVLCPDFGFSTRAMYAEVSRWDLTMNLTLRPEEIVDFISSKAGHDWRVLPNDFEKAAEALFPEAFERLQVALAVCEYTLETFSRLPWTAGMTGSGSALYVLTPCDSALERVDFRAAHAVLVSRLKSLGFQVFKV